MPVTNDKLGREALLLPTCADKHAPGTEGIWTFVFMDMVIFLLIFLVFMSERQANLSQYLEAQQALMAVFGLANTLVLLISSWLVFEAVSSARQRLPERVSRQLKFAILLGGVFCFNKLIEYYLKFTHGVDIKNSFFSFYFFITIIHLLHVVAGMLFLNAYRKSSVACISSKKYLPGLENTGLFWHFVDVLWVFIFPLLYLV